MTTAKMKTARDGAVATVTITRPEVSNAFDDELIALLTEAFRELGQDDGVRAIVLRGDGKHFCAGADLNWMRRMASYTREENLADSRKLARLMQTIDTCPKPTIAVVHGAAFGGGVGLAACCDIALATERALFCLSEVKIGLIPSVISPYVVAAIGPRQSRRYFLTAERIDAQEACRIGLVHEVVPGDDLEARLTELIQGLLKNGPQAVAASKELVARVRFARDTEALQESLALTIAETRVSAEGQEGMTAFLEKRPARWVTDAS